MNNNTNVDFTLKDNETFFEQKNRISKEMFGVAEFDKLTTEQRHELNDALDAFNEENAKEFEIKEFSLDYAKELYNRLGCIKMKNGWVDKNDLSCGVSNETIERLFKYEKYKQIDPKGKVIIDTYGKYFNERTGAWNKDFPWYKKVVFTPFNKDLNEEEEYNLWKPNEYKKIPLDDRGDFIQDFIFEVICNHR